MGNDKDKLEVFTEKGTVKPSREVNKAAIRLVLDNLKGLTIEQAEDVLYEAGREIKRVTFI